MNWVVRDKQQLSLELEGLRNIDTSKMKKPNKMVMSNLVGDLTLRKGEKSHFGSNMIAVTRCLFKRMTMSNS